MSNIFVYNFLSGCFFIRLFVMMFKCLVIITIYLLTACLASVKGSDVVMWEAYEAPVSELPYWYYTDLPGYVRFKTKAPVPHGLRVDFCDLKYYCVDFRHTVCELHHNCRQTSSCTASIPLTHDEKRNILNKHNELRNKVALGEGQFAIATHDLLPQASDMQELVWDVELEFLAQCLANQCEYHQDRCRKKTNRIIVGQNVAIGNNIHNIIEHIDRMFAEYKNISNLDIIDHYTHQHGTGHFTQIVNAKTTEIGCGRSKFLRADFEQEMLVCNYAIAGNLEDYPVYKRGKPCSECPSTCHETYKGLCKTEPSTTKEPNICDPNDPDCGPILENPGINGISYNHREHTAGKHGHKRSQTQKAKPTGKMNYVRKSGGGSNGTKNMESVKDCAVSRENSFGLMGFIGYIAVRYY